ncbi:MAG TPA: hypothetical protein VGT44_22525, partial [Ktedonobacteraceae bacterium]|nr:hypothetical protein [Ktedonobacteraceae bacterium]
IEYYEQAWQLLAEQPVGYAMQAKFPAPDVQQLFFSLGRAYELTRTWEHGRHMFGAMLERLLQMAAQDDSANGLAKAQWYRAMLDMYTADQAVAIAHGERALALARSIEQSDLIVQSLDALAHLKMRLGAWEENEQLVAEARALYAAMRDRAMEADCLCLLANAHLHRGRPPAGIAQARNALTISQEIENTWGQVNAIHEVTSGLLDIGAYTEALESALRAVARARTQPALIAGELVASSQSHSIGRRLPGNPGVPCCTRG